jgi:hypothetical protein
LAYSKHIPKTRFTQLGNTPSSLVIGDIQFYGQGVINSNSQDLVGKFVGFRVRNIIAFQRLTIDLDNGFAKEWLKNYRNYRKQIGAD